MRAARTKDSVPIIVMDLSRSTQVIHADLRARWPNVIDLWWELDEGERTGTVSDHKQLLAKLQHDKKSKKSSTKKPATGKSQKGATRIRVQIDATVELDITTESVPAELNSELFLDRVLRCFGAVRNANRVELLRPAHVSLDVVTPPPEDQEPINPITLAVRIDEIADDLCDNECTLAQPDALREIADLLRSGKVVSR